MFIVSKVDMKLNKNSKINFFFFFLQNPLLSVKLKNLVINGLYEGCGPIVINRDGYGLHSSRSVFYVPYGPKGFVHVSE